MDDLQKKLDELIILRDTLAKITNGNFNLKDINNISTGEFNSIVFDIIKNHNNQLKKNRGFFNNATRASNQLLHKSQALSANSRALTVSSHQTLNRSQQLMAESKQLAIKSKQLANKSRTLDRQSRELAVTSQQLIKQNQQLTNINANDFKNKNNETFSTSTNAIRAVIEKINVSITSISAQLAELTMSNKLSNLSNSIEFQQWFIATFLVSDLTVMSNDTLKLILLNIKSHCDWHYPGLQLNPMSKEWIDCMITADPLYITGTNLTAIINAYPPEYQRRIRIYDAQDFSILPQGQFGSIACCNLFEIFTIENYLITFFKLLRPGGKLICNLPFIYTTNESIDIMQFDLMINLVIENIFNRIGYTIISLIKLPSTECSLILITAQRPGILTTTKAHQVLGSIITK
jgi:hypothetical protein